MTSELRAGELVALRHALHETPEIGLDLPATQRLILDGLSDLDLEITTGTSCSSIVGVLRGGATNETSSRPSVLLRADMDALPLVEETDLDYRSKIDGAMHACGHDMHAAMLVGAAHQLTARRADLAGDVIFMFQPGEEGFDGAQAMLDEGVLEASGRVPSAAWALHVMSRLSPRGVISGRGGPILSAIGELRVTVLGKGGHGSTPEQSKDPIPAAAEMVNALQSMISRTTSAFAPVVLTVGTFHAGTRSYIIPSKAEFAATVRCFDDELVVQLAANCERLCQGIAFAHGLDVDVQFVPLYPVTVNDPDAVALAARTVSATFGSSRWVDLPSPLMNSEDYSRILQRVPGAMIFLGASATDDWTSAPDNHSTSVTFDDSVLGDGADLLSELAVQSLQDCQQ